MPLTLEVVGQKASRMGANARKTFHAGGTIGRESDNDWEFPDEYISGHHAKITLGAGIFTITDTSTNGVFINSPQNRLTRGQPYTLHDGDTVYIDDYEVRVTLGVEPSYTTDTGPSATADNVFDEPTGVDETDPLLLLGIGPRKVSRGPTAESLANKSALSQNFQPPPPPPLLNPPPESTPPKRIVPKGYNPFGPKVTPNNDSGALALSSDNSKGRGADSGGKADSAFGNSSPSGTAPINPGALAVSNARARLAEGSRASRNPPPVEPRQIVQPPLSNGVAPNGVAPNGVVVQPPLEPGPNRRSSGRADLDFAALLAAAGIDSVQATPELAEQFGQILRTVVAGLMDVLRARDTIKNEFRMRMTTFKQADNNPLKYSANVDDALFNLLVKRNSAYLGPVEAFEDAFQDVRSHQMSMLAGMRVAYDSMLAAFDPAHLQAEFDRQVKSGSFLNSSRSKYWELYGNKFRDLVKDADSTFRKLFGDEFAKAYEEQLARLKTQKRTDRP